MIPKINQNRETKKYRRYRCDLCKCVFGKQRNNFLFSFQSNWQHNSMKVTQVSRNSLVFQQRRFITYDTVTEILVSFPLFPLMLQFSITFSTILIILKTLYMWRHKNARFLSFIEKSKRIFLLFLMANPILFSILKFSYRLTDKIFREKNKKFVDILSVISGLTIGVSFGFRIFILLFPSAFILGKPVILVYFEINALFRSILALGLLLHSHRGFPFWDQTVRNKQRTPRFIGYFFYGNYLTNAFNPSKKYNPYRQKKESQWNNWGAVGSIISGIMGIVSMIVSMSEYTYQKNDVFPFEMQQPKEIICEVEEKNKISTSSLSSTLSPLTAEEQQIFDYYLFVVAVLREDVTQLYHDNKISFITFEEKLKELAELEIYLQNAIENGVDRDEPYIWYILEHLDLK